MHAGTAGVGEGGDKMHTGTAEVEGRGIQVLGYCEGVHGDTPCKKEIPFFRLRESLQGKAGGSPVADK